jgi:hypothetical protein
LLSQNQLVPLYATGVSDVNQVIQKFMTQEDTNNNLKQLTKEAQSRIDSLNEDKEAAKAKLEELKYSGAGGSGSRRIVDEYEQQLSEGASKNDRVRLKFERVHKVGLLQLFTPVYSCLLLFTPVYLELDDSAWFQPLEPEMCSPGFSFFFFQMQLAPLRLGADHHEGGHRAPPRQARGHQARGGGLYKLHPAETQSLEAHGFNPRNLQSDLVISNYAFSNGSSCTATSRGRRCPCRTRRWWT